jgi:hypothetical protein
VNQYLQEAAAAKFEQWDWRRRVDQREPLVAKYAWAIPDDNAIEALARMGPIVEMGAGNGYWARLIADAGGKIEPYDMKPGCHCRDTVPSRLWYPVMAGGPKSIADRHRDHVLLLVWPPYQGELAFLAITQYLLIGGRSVVFVGESRGGCTGDDRFFDALNTHFDEVGSVDIPQWSGLHDDMTVYQRKMNPW